MFTNRASIKNEAHYPKTEPIGRWLPGKLFVSGRRFIATLAISLLLVTNSVASESVAPEYKLKAALIFKLTHFVHWPTLSAKAGNKQTKNFAICILGENPFGGVLEPLRKRDVRGAPIYIRYYAQSEDIESSCQLLFISDSKRAFTQTILQRFRGEATLTLSDIKDFAAQGGMIELTQGNSKIGFTINPNQAKRAGLAIAAPLLELATIVD